MEKILQYPKDNHTENIRSVHDSYSRHEWRTVNFSRFLYDKVEDIYIPEEVCRELVQGGPAQKKWQ